MSFVADPLEPRRLLSTVRPAFAAQIGLGDLLTPDTSFEDNFDGTALDAARWQIREGPRWRDTPAATTFTYTSREAIQVGGGELSITAYTDPLTGQTRSGWIQTSNDFIPGPYPGQPDSALAPGYAGNFKQRYGYWEARMKINLLPGTWGAFWVHSPRMTEVLDDPATANHPEIYGTEYDVAEMASVRGGAGVSDEVSTVVHANGYRSLHRSSGVNTNTRWQAPSYAAPSAYHVYGLLWTPVGASFYIDGNLVQRESDPAMVSKIAQVAMLSVDVGAPGSKVQGEGSNYFGTMPAGGYGTREASPVRLVADYLRVWPLASEQAAPPAPVVPRADVSGSVFTDANANGARDAGESPRANAGVYLDLNYNGSRQLDEPLVSTAADGTYRFTNAPVTRALAVRLQADPAFARTTPAGDGAIWIATDASAAYTLVPFGVRDLQQPPVPPAGTFADVSGLVFADANADASLQPAEAGQAGIRVYLDLNMNARREADEPTTLSAADGTYRFDSVRPANALAIRLDLGGTDATQTTVGGAGALWLAPAAGRSYPNQRFGVTLKAASPVPPVLPPVPPPMAPPSPSRASASGRVYFDYNRNGRGDAGEGGINGATLFVDRDYDGVRDADEAYVTTRADGTFRFDDLAAGVVVFRIDDRNQWYANLQGENGVWRNLIAGATSTDVVTGVAAR